MIFNRRRIADLTRQLEEAHALLQKAQQSPVLIGIERDGRLNRFIFAKNGEIHKIETMGLISDNIKEWKDTLLS